MIYRDIASKLKTVWLDVALAGDGVTVIKENQNAPRPALPYAVIDLSTDAKQGMAYYSPSDINGDQTIKVEHRLTAIIHFFGKYVGQYAQKAQDALDKYTIIEALKQEDFVIVEEPTITEIPVTREETIEERWELAIVIGFSRQFTDTVGYIENVELIPDIVVP